MSGWEIPENLARTFRGNSELVASLMDNADVAVVPQSPDESQIAFLDKARKDLKKVFESSVVKPEFMRIFKLIKPSARLQDETEVEERKLWLERCGIRGEGKAKISKKHGCHLYPLLQVRAADPTFWAHPGHGILHSVTQIAFGEQLRGGGDDDERLFTSSMLSAITYGVKDAIKDVRVAGASLPPGMHMDLSTLDMQGRRDELDSDLGLVVGLRVNGKPLYRVCVLQAKWRPRYGGHIGQRNGAQLEGVLSTGMGYYVFFPNPDPHKRDDFRFASVLSAQAVYEQVWKTCVPDYRGVDTLRSGTEVAVDFPTFLSRYMTSNDLALGRIFSSPEEAADALRGKRKLPICRRVLLADTTDTMLIARFEATFSKSDRTAKRLPRSAAYASSVSPEREASLPHQPSAPSPFGPRR